LSTGSSEFFYSFEGRLNGKSRSASLNGERLKVNSKQLKATTIITNTNNNSNNCRLQKGSNRETSLPTTWNCSSKNCKSKEKKPKKPKKPPNRTSDLCESEL